MDVGQRAPIINKVGGTVTNVPGGSVRGAKRPTEGTISVRSPSGAVEVHTIYNARDLINHHGYVPVSRPRLVNIPANVISDTTIDEAENIGDNVVSEDMEGKDVLPTEADGAAEGGEAPVDPNVAELEALRTAFENKTGKKPHHKLGKAALKKAIDEAE